MVLFENYYVDVMQLTEQVVVEVKNQLDSGKYQPVPGGFMVHVSVGDDSFDIGLVGTNSYTHSLATIDRHTWRKTVKLKNQQTRRRIMPIGRPLIKIYVANQLMTFHGSKEFINPDTLKYIKENSTGSYTFISKTPQYVFLDACQGLISSSIFTRALGHELQHYAEPWAHKRMPKTVKKAIPAHVADADTDLTKAELQKYMNYLLSNSEVDSAVVETAVRVITTSRDTKQKLTQREFIERGINLLITAQKWQFYSEEVQRKIIRKLAIIFHEYRKRKNSVTDSSRNSDR